MVPHSPPNSEFRITRSPCTARGFVAAGPSRRGGGSRVLHWGGVGRIFSTLGFQPPSRIEDEEIFVPRLAPSKRPAAVKRRYFELVRTGLSGCQDAGQVSVSELRIAVVHRRRQRELRRDSGQQV